MNKKILAWLTVTVMMISCLAGAFAKPVTIQPDMKLKADDSAVQAIVKENPEEEGISPPDGAAHDRGIYAHCPGA